VGDVGGEVKKKDWFERGRGERMDMERDTHTLDTCEERRACVNTANETHLVHEELET
jgi:hypothetical protein